MGIKQSNVGWRYEGAKPRWVETHETELNVGRDLVLMDVWVPAAAGASGGVQKGKGAGHGHSQARV